MRSNWLHVIVFGVPVLVGLIAEVVPSVTPHIWLSCLVWPLRLLMLPTERLSRTWHHIAGNYLTGALGIVVVGQIAIVIADGGAWIGAIGTGLEVLRYGIPLVFAVWTAATLSREEKRILMIVAGVSASLVAMGSLMVVMQVGTNASAWPFSNPNHDGLVAAIGTALLVSQMVDRIRDLLNSKERFNIAEHKMLMFGFALCAVDVSTIIIVEANSVLALLACTLALIAMPKVRGGDLWLDAIALLVTPVAMLLVVDVYTGASQRLSVWTEVWHVLQTYDGPFNNWLGLGMYEVNARWWGTQVGLPYATRTLGLESFWVWLVTGCGLTTLAFAGWWTKVQFVTLGDRAHHRNADISSIIARRVVWLLIAVSTIDHAILAPSLALAAALMVGVSTHTVPSDLGSD